MQQLQFDHFWFPKLNGGNFLMRSKTGLYVNNCIPLCSSCNPSKGAKPIEEFFADDSKKLIDTIRCSQSINSQINAAMMDFNDPDFQNRRY